MPELTVVLYLTIARKLEELDATRLTACHSALLSQTNWFSIIISVF